MNTTWKVVQDDGQYMIWQVEDDESYWLGRKNKEGDAILTGSAAMKYDKNGSPTGIWVTGIYQDTVYRGPDEQMAVEQLWEHRHKS